MPDKMQQSPPSWRGSQPAWHTRDPIQELQSVVFGIDGTNGLRSISRVHHSRIEDLEQWRREIKTIFSTLRTTVRWGAIVIFMVVVTFGSDQTMAWVAARVKLAKDAGLF